MRACVDLDAGVVRLQRSLGRRKKREDGKAWRLADTKTRKSRRTVPLTDAVTRALRSHRARQAAEWLEAGEKYRDYGDGGFVFAKPDGSPYRAESQLQVLHRALARLGLPKVDLYSLRHAAASLRLHAGVPLKVVSELLGQSSIVLTADTYSHVTDQLQQDASDRFTAIWKRQRCDGHEAADVRLHRHPGQLARGEVGRMPAVLLVDVRLSPHSRITEWCSPALRRTSTTDGSHPRVTASSLRTRAHRRVAPGRASCSSDSRTAAGAGTARRIDLSVSESRRLSPGRCGGAAGAPAPRDRRW